VLLGATAMPTAGELPKSLEPLVFLNAARLRPDPDFSKDVDALCHDLGLPEPAGDSAPNRLKSLHVSLSAVDSQNLLASYTLLFGSPEAIVPISRRLVSRKKLAQISQKISNGYLVSPKASSTWSSRRRECAGWLSRLNFDPETLNGKCSSSI